MTKFIRLTEPYHSGDRPILINTDHIRSIKPGDKSRDTLINMTHTTEMDGKPSKYYFVKESIDQIWLMINEVPAPNNYIGKV